MKKAVSLCCVILLSAALLSLTGCPKPEGTPPVPQQNNNGGGTKPASPGTTTAEGLKLPLQPSAQDTLTTELPQLAAVLPASVFGKTAQDAAAAIPAADLAAQIDEYIKKLEEIDDLDTASRDASALTLVALAAGISKEDSKYKKSAAGIISAAGEIAKAKTVDDAKKLYEKLKTASSAESPAVTAGTKAAELTPIMKAVPNLSSTITRTTNTEKKLKKVVEKSPEKVYGPLAALAAISQGAVANSKDTTPVDEAKWKAECEQFCDAALKANAAAHGFTDGKVSYDDYSKALKNMTDTCDKCHEVFHKAAAGKNE
ncbi:hypothetical protein FACS189427_01130 [Planctomycetales bacterium]|nr:hypothetical protein FACS189427_01130 [Planctomycetales bacterium]